MFILKNIYRLIEHISLLFNKYTFSIRFTAQIPKIYNVVEQQRSEILDPHWVYQKLTLSYQR